MAEVSDSKLQWLNFRQLLSNVRKLPKDEVKVFRLATSFQLASISIFSGIVLCTFLWAFLEFNSYYFESAGRYEISNFSETFFEYVLSRVYDYVPFAAAFVIVMLFIGFYVANLLLRPFRIIGDYCETHTGSLEVKGRESDVTYDPDYFSDLRMLTRFSEYFFSMVEEKIRSAGTLSPTKIPDRYTKIHKPQFEKTFFLQFSLIIIFTSIIVGVALTALSVDLHSQIIAFANETLKLNKAGLIFIEKQKALLTGISIGVVLVNSILNFLFCFYLYSRVSAPAFGIFATFRSFLKGNNDARVHMLGYYYIRNESRKINKYLDTLQKNYTKS